MLGIPAVASGLMTAVTYGGVALSTTQAAYGHYRNYRRAADSVEAANHMWQNTTKLLGFSDAAAPSNTTIASSDNNTAVLVDSASALMSSMMLWKGWSAFSYLLKKTHGPDAEAALKAKNSAAFDSAFSSSESNLLSTKGWKAEYFDKMGKVAPKWLQNLPMDNKILIGGFLSVLATYLHKIGCDTMRINARAMGVDYEHPVEAGLRSEDDASQSFFGRLNLRRMCYNLYLGNKFYTAEGASMHMLDSSPLNNNVLRIIANVMIGMFKQTGILNTNTRDPVNVFLTAAELTGYWEVLAHLIGLYGWAPVYITTHWLLQSMLLPASSKK
jgi:hypothetical protein